MDVLGLNRGCLRGIWSVSGGCLEGVLTVSDGCLQVIKRGVGGHKKGD